MASIQKVENKNGISYKINVHLGYNAQGKKITKSTTFVPDPQKSARQNEKDLQKKILDFENDVKNGDICEGKKKLFEDFAYECLSTEVKNKCTHGTYKGYRIMLETRIIPFFKGYKVANIRLPLIEKFYLSVADDYTIATIKKSRIVLNGIFERAKRYHMIKINACDDAKLPKAGKKTAELKYFTPEQSLTFLDSLNMEFEQTFKGHSRIDDTGKPYIVGDYIQTKTVPTQFKVFFNIALYCGLRTGEILALFWDDIDFEEWSINVTKSVEPVKGGLAYKEPKTKTSIRKVGFPEAMLPLLRQYRNEYDTLKMELGSAWKGNNNIFIQSDGKLMRLHTAYHRFLNHIDRYNDYVEKMNKSRLSLTKLEKLPVIPLHGLRHSCATLLNWLCENIVEISNVLGHAQTSTTMNIYAHSSFNKFNSRASDRIDEFLQMRKQA